MTARPPMHVERHLVTTADGWVLELHRGVRAGATRGAPVLFVPGFGMNGFIFRYHPSGPSFMESLLDAGLDPWSMDLRGQTTARRGRGADADFGLADHAFLDLPAAFDHVARLTGAPRVHAIGCSLGGALLYGYGGGEAHRIDRLVTMGTPFRWTATSAVVRAFGRMAPVFGRVPVRGTRMAARVGLPVASRVLRRPLSVYLNPALTRTSPSRELVRTVEDPHPRINRQLGKWIRAGDLKLGEVIVAEALARFDRPLLVIAGAGDRICPPATALAAVPVAKGPTRGIVVGGPGQLVAHADLFIADLVHEQVYPEVVRWLTAIDPALS